MSNEPAYIRNLKALTRGEPTVADIEALERELYGASDRATAVMLGSMVEISLERLLGTLIRSDLNSSDRGKIFEYDGPLRTFAAKTVMAYALKLIGPKSRADLDLVRLLRNEFAHSRKPFGFSTPEVKAVCDRLRMPDQPGAYIPHGFLERVSHEDLKAAADKTDPKTRYIMACHNLAYRMLVARSDEASLPSAQFTDDPLP
jgi:hypothetical protein